MSKDVEKPHGEATFVIIKPDAVARGLIGNIISRIEAKGLEIASMRMHHIDLAEAKKLYQEHWERDFFDRLVQFTTSGPSVLIVIRGNHAIEVVRTMIGSTDCAKATPSTIRGDLGISSFDRNLIHASRTSEDFEREWRIFEEDMYKEKYVVPYRADRKTIYSVADV